MIRPFRLVGRTCLTLAVGSVLLAGPAKAEPGRPPLPEPALRLTTTLTLTAEPDAAGEAERALLRLESRAGQLAVEEGTAVEDLLLRLERMGRTVAALQPLIATMPSAAAPPAAPATCPKQPAAPEGHGGDMSWLLLTGGVLVLALLGLLWHYRRRGATDAGGDDTFSWHTEPAPMTLQATLPPTPFVPVSRKLEEANPAATAPEAKPEAEPEAEPPVAAAPAASPPEPPPATPVLASGPLSPSEADLSLELAEVMLSMRMTDSAAQTLEEHIRAHPRQALIHWLKLLDIYRQSGQQADFEESALQLQQHFNIAPPDWPAGSQLAAAAPQLPSLEHHAHVIGRIQELWPRRSCAEYLDRLLADNRGGTRTGFPPAVVEEILLLLSVLRP